MISIVIPTHNPGHKLERLLQSIAESGVEEKEIIVVDDSSSQCLKETASRFPIRIARTPRQSGPATARNLGARLAGGDILLFLDDDVVMEPDALREVERFFEAHPDRHAMIGVYSSEPVNRGLLPRYKALQCFSFYQNHDEISAVSLLWAAKTAIRRELFLSLGGFDESFARPSMEDLELGRRITKQTPIYLNRRVVVRHEFPSTLRRNMKDHFDRGSLWVRLFFRHKRFDNYLHTRRRGFSRLAAFASVPAFLASAFYPPAAIAGAALLLAYLAANADFWILVLKRRPRDFFPFLGIDYVLGITLGLAALRAGSAELLGRVVPGLAPDVDSPVVPIRDK
ncbi:MAG: glycosyltransferase [Gemmatimonadetes bacterium]|nr:glycosyltransferase [Gemmatimonadota bacterium]